MCGVDVRAAAPTEPFTRTVWPQDDEFVAGGDVGCGTTAGGDVTRDGWIGVDGEFDGRDYITKHYPTTKKRLPNSEMPTAMAAIHCRQWLNMSAFMKFSGVSIGVSDVEYESKKQSILFEKSYRRYSSCRRKRISKSGMPAVQTTLWSVMLWRNFFVLWYI